MGSNFFYFAAKFLVNRGENAEEVAKELAMALRKFIEENKGACDMAAEFKRLAE